MAKLAQISILFALVAIPAWASSGRNAQVGLKRAALAMTGFAIFYWLSVVFFTPEA
jgi:hypothetical protein